MDPLLRGTVVVVALGSLIRVMDWARPSPMAPSPRAPAPRGDHQVPSSPATGAPSPCPPGTLPDGRACVPAQTADRGRIRGSSLPDDRAGSAGPDWIPKGPDRPSELDRYLLPVEHGLEAVLGSNDLGFAKSAPNIGPRLESCAGMNLAVTRGTEATAVALRDQVGDAEVLESKDLGGAGVVLVYGTSQPTSYLVVYRGLAETAPGTERGARLKPGAFLGRVGTPKHAGLVHLCFEVRKLRDGVDVHTESVQNLEQNALSLPMDPRNVMKLR